MGAQFLHLYLILHVQRGTVLSGLQLGTFLVTHSNLELDVLANIRVLPLQELHVKRITTSLELWNRNSSRSQLFLDIVTIYHKLVQLDIAILRHIFRLADDLLSGLSLFEITGCGGHLLRNLIYVLNVFEVDIALSSVVRCSSMTALASLELQLLLLSERLTLLLKLALQQISGNGEELQQFRGPQELVSNDLTAETLQVGNDLDEGLWLVDVSLRRRLEGGLCSRNHA